MRAREFISESKTISAEAVWNYVKRIHPVEQQGGGFLERLIKQYPNYQLQSVPLASLIIHDQESDDPDEEPPEDPYGRVQVVDPEYAGEVSVHNLDRNPIVIDRDGHILDGNHRAWAAAELLGRDTIQAWVPVEQLSEVGNAPSPHQPVRQRKRSAFWANVEDRELVVFFDRSSLNGALQITFTVDGSYDLTGAQGKLAFRIFSTVLDIIRQRLPEYLKSRYTGTITFTAKLGEGRTAVYEKFANMLTQMVGDKYERQPNIDTMGQTLFSWDRKPKSVTEEAFNGIDISLEIQKDDEYVDDEDYDNQVIYVTASSNGRELGHVLFAFDGEYLMPQDLEVDERYRGQGIAATMYDYVKSRGYKIRRSGQQTAAGTGFWAKHNPGQNVWEEK